MSNISKLESLTRNWCVYILYNTNRTKVYVGSTYDLKDRLRKHNRLASGGINWSPVLAITGFHSDREATKFESNVRILAKKKEFSEYASLYTGSCPAVVVKRILAIRCLLCEYDSWWKVPCGKKRREYVLHWGTYMDIDSRQLEILQNCPWSRIDRVVKHIKMDPMTNESAITSIAKNKNKEMSGSSNSPASKRKNFRK